MSLTYKVLSSLLDQADTPISGQTLANQLGVSRNSIWKVIEQLKAEGYQITSIPSQGYQLKHISSMLDSNQIMYLVQDHLPDLSIIYADWVTSTNDLAKSHLIEHPKQTALFISNHQSKGRGRQGRSFHSDIQEGIYFSLALPSQTYSIESIGLFTIMAAVAMAKALEKNTEIAIKIKWVNDLFAGGRKVVGILTEANANLENQQIDAVILGIGINVVGDFSKLDPDIQKVAGPLFPHPESAHFNRNHLLSDFLLNFYSYLHVLPARPFIEEYRTYLLGLNQRVCFTKNQEKRQGIILGINQDGHLLIQNEVQEIESLNSSEIHFSSQAFINQTN